MSKIGLDCVCYIDAQFTQHSLFQICILPTLGIYFLSRSTSAQLSFQDTHARHVHKYKYSKRIENHK